jgi:sugar O-acyltransferase (sialic acid O-acetyltransferase NeuD family)
MRNVVIYAVGSPIVVDVEESLARAGIDIVAAIRNTVGEVFLLDRRPLVELADMKSAIKEHPYLVPLFTPANRASAAHEAMEHGFSQPFSLIDPSVVCPQSLTHAPGLYVNAGCTLGAAGVFGEFVLINRGASLGHHARLGDFVSIGPGAVVAGNVTVHRGAVVGAGAVVLPEVTIGANSVVGAGAVVTGDVPDRCLVVGNPARIVKTDIAGFGDRGVD